nr:hypothetical protein [Tanacetum cinerariifolium]
MQKVVEDDDFKSETWISVTNYVTATGGTVTGLTMKDLSGTIHGTIRYKVIRDDDYGNDIIVGAAMILANVSVFTPKPSKHYLNITIKNVVKDINNFLKKEKLDQVVAIVKSCSSNLIGDLTMTMKDLSSTIPETIHYKVIGDDDYEKNIIV